MTMKLLDVKIGRYRMTSSCVTSIYSGNYDVQFYVDGKLTMLQTWGKCPTEQDFIEYIQVYLDYDKGENV